MESKDSSGADVSDFTTRSSLEETNATASSVVGLSRYDMDRLASWIRRESFREQLDGIGDVVNVIPCSSGVFKPKEPIKNTDRMDWLGHIGPSLNDEKRLNESSNVPSNPALQNNEIQAKYEYLIKAKGKMAAPLNKGVPRKATRDRNRERYNNAEANVKKRMHSDESISIGTPLKKPKSISGNTKALSENRKAGRQAESQFNDSSSSDDVDITAKPNVFVRHAKHPEITLQDEEMKTIQRAILDEMDKIDGAELYPQFLASSKKRGWISITCNNKESKNWIMPVLKKVKPDLSVLEEDKTSYVCIAYIPTEDNMSKETFLLRIGRQNPGLSTNSWRVARMTRGKSGGIIAIFYVDDASKVYIKERRSRLFLNLSQIRVDIRQKNYFISAMDDEMVKVRHAQAIPKPKSQDIIVPKDPTGSGDKSSLGAIIAQCLSNMYVDEEKSKKNVQKRRRKKKSRRRKATDNSSSAASDS